MTFTDFPWPSNISLFPESSSVKGYLQAYAARMQSTDPGESKLEMRYSTEIIDLRKSTLQGQKFWTVKAKQQTLFESSTEQVDRVSAVVIAFGNYHRRYVPNTEHIREWDKVHPGTLTHSITFQKPGDFRNEVVLVVGNSASGWDISAQLAGAAKKVIVSSERYQAKSGPQQLSAPTHHGVNGVVRFDSATKSVLFKDDTVQQIDRAIFCTGYEYDFSFIKRGTTNGDLKLFDSGVIVRNVYRHIFYTEDPTLAFIGLPTMSAPFTVTEAQSAVVARAFNSRLPLPSRPALQRWYDEESRAYEAQVRAGTADARHYHSFKLTEDKAYVNALLEWSLETARLKNNGTVFRDDGKPPTFWYGCMDAARAGSRDIRTRFKALGEQRHSYTSHQSLGHDLQVACGPGQYAAYKSEFRCKACFIGNGA